MEVAEEILGKYNLSPIKIEKIRSKLYKITDTHGVYALKKAKFNEFQAQNWLRIYSKEDLLKYLIPLYISKENSLFVTVGDYNYYLSPWIHNDKKASLLSAHQILGEIHLKTLDKKLIRTKNFIEQLSLYEEKIRELKKKSQETLEVFEQSHFMSPIELQYCTHFHQVQEAFYLIEQELNQIKKINEEGLEWNTCLIHGNFIRDHIIQEENASYIINWEKASYHYPIYDLVSLYIDEAKNVIGVEDDILQAFVEYMKRVKLQPHELSFIFINLLDSAKYFQLLFSKTSMLKKTKEVEEEFRVIKLGLYLVKNYSHSK